MNAGSFELLHRHEEGRCLLSLSGELDIAQARRVREALVGCQDVEGVVVDARGLTFIDSTGFAALVVGRNQVGADRFHLVPGEVAERMIDLSGARAHFGL